MIALAIAAKTLNYLEREKPSLCILKQLSIFFGNKEKIHSVVERLWRVMRIAALYPSRRGERMRWRVILVVVIEGCKYVVEETDKHIEN